MSTNHETTADERSVERVQLQSPIIDDRCSRLDERTLGGVAQSSRNACGQPPNPRTPRLSAEFARGHFGRGLA
jgi:hypothetical protein